LKLAQAIKNIKNLISINWKLCLDQNIIHFSLISDNNMWILNKNKWINKIPNIFGLKEYLLRYDILSSIVSKVSTVITEDRFRPNIVI
jgi:hypothetical protein